MRKHQSKALVQLRCRDVVNTNFIYEQAAQLNNFVVTSDEFMHAFIGIQQCAERSLAYKEPIGSMLLAKGGLGKTTLCNTIVNQMPRSFKIEGDRKKTIIPAFYVEVPSPITVKALAITMLQKLGDQTNLAGTTTYLTNRLTYLLVQCETQLVFLDEFHHLFERRFTSTRINPTVGNWIKTLVNETTISFCLVGLPEFAELLQIDSQIARRFPYQFKLNPLTLGKKGSLGTIYPFLSEVTHKAAEIQISFSPKLDNNLLATQIFVATRGYHSYVMSLIRESVVMALQDGRSIVTVNDFSLAWQLGITFFISKQKINPFEMTLTSLVSILRES